MMGETNLGLPMDQVRMDATKAAAVMTGQEKGMMFHIDKVTLQDVDQDRLLWQERPARNWDTGNWSGLSAPADQTTPTRNLHSGFDMEEVSGARMSMCELKTY